MSIPFLDSRSPKDEQGQKGCQMKNKFRFKLVFSYSVVSNSLQLHGLKNARLLCPSLSCTVCSDSCPLNWWCHPTISSSVVPSPPALNLSQHQGLFQCVRWPKYWSFSFSISPSNEYSGLISFRIDCLISLHSKGLSRVFFNHTVQKHQFFSAQLYLQFSSHIHPWLLKKS